MTGFSALYNAVSGLQAQSARIGIASQNIANQTTPGYKEGRSEFTNLFGSLISGSTDTGGVRSITTQQNQLQGDITPDSVPTHIAVSGDGFFAVTQNLSTTGGAVSNGLLYTRDGTFKPDQNGNLINDAGYFLQGWKLNPDGTIPTDLQGTPAAGSAEAALTTVNVPQSNGLPTATSLLSFKANLNSSQLAYNGTPPYNAADPTANMASGAVTPQFSQTIEIIDSTGAAHDTTVGYLKTGTNSWAVEMFADTAGDVAGGNPQLASGNLTFNGDGTLASVSPSLTQPGAVSWTTAGAAASTFTINWGTPGVPFGTPNATVIGRADGIEQLDSTSASNGVTNNGVQVGTLTSVTITPDGFLTGEYSNGSIQKIYMIPVTRFLDSNQLAAVSNNAFTPTIKTSAPEYVQPGTEESGTLDDSATENSNTNQDSELTNLIISQQSYQFNSELISKEDDMLQNLTQMVV